MTAQQPTQPEKHALEEILRRVRSIDHHVDEIREQLEELFNELHFDLELDDLDDGFDPYNGV